MPQEQSAGFSQMLKHYRKQQGYTQAQAAAALGYSKDTIAAWEYGRRIPTNGDLPRLASMLELDAATVTRAVNASRLEAYIQKINGNMLSEEQECDGKEKDSRDTTNFVRTEQQDTLLHVLSQAVESIIEALCRLEGTNHLNIADPITRRAIIAHLLGIPPALLALDGSSTSSSIDTIRLPEGPSLALYEDLLTLGWDCFRRSKTPQIIHKIDTHTNKLTTLARYAPEKEREHWLSLLCRFSQLSTRIAQHTMNEQRAFSLARQAIAIAIELDDAELIASAFYRRGRVYMEHSNTAPDAGQKQRHFARTKADIDAALGYVERIRTPLAGNIYLIAAEIYALVAGTDASLRTQCEAWQDKVAALVYGESIEDDGTFLKLDPTALHHEKAKTLLHFGRVQDAHRELNTAWNTLPSNLFTWQMNMHLTEASLFLAERNVEGSATSDIKAYTLAKIIQSHKGKVEVKQQFGELQKVDTASASVRDLSMLIGGEA
jgi:transcriptional regulator with XRE-family HTH domain